MTGFATLAQMRTYVVQWSVCRNTERDGADAMPTMRPIERSPDAEQLLTILGDQGVATFAVRLSREELERALQGF